MARSILISYGEDITDGGVGFAYNTLVFELIAGGIRAGFEGANQECMRECFEDLDEMGSEFISVCDVSPCCFRKFVAACERGLHSLRVTRDVAIDYMVEDVDVDSLAKWWQELLDTLYADPRMNLP